MYEFSDCCGRKNDLGHGSAEAEHGRSDQEQFAAMNGRSKSALPVEIAESETDADDALQLFHDLRIADKGGHLLLEDVDLGPGGYNLSPSPIYKLPSTIVSRRAGAIATDDFLTDSNKHDYDWLLTPPSSPLSCDNVAITAAISSLAKGKGPGIGVESLLSQQSSMSLPPVRTSPRPSSSSSRAAIISDSHQPANSSRSRSRSSSSSSRHTTPTPGRSYLSRQSTPTASAGSRPATATTTGSSNRKLTRSGASSRSSTPTSTRTAPASSSRPSTPTSASSRNAGSPRSTASSSTSVRKAASFPRSSSTSKVSSMTVGAAAASRIPAMVRGTFPTVKLKTVAGLSAEPPSNLRTSAPPERSSSAKKVRPAVVPKPSAVSSTPAAGDGYSNWPRRMPSPSPSRVRVTKDSGQSSIKSVLQSSKFQNLGTLDKMQSKPVSTIAKSVSSALHSKMNVKSGASETARFGMTLSKSSLEMALRHMDIRRTTTTTARSTNTSSSSLYSLWSGTNKTRRSNMSDSTGPSGSNTSSEYGASICPDPEGSEFSDESKSEKGNSEQHLIDKCDSLDFKAEAGSTNWLLDRIDDSDDQFLFDNNGFEYLSDPIGNDERKVIYDKLPDKQSTGHEVQ